MSKIRIGIVGCGAIHGTHAEAVHGVEAASLAGFFDIVPERAQAASQKYGGRAFRSLNALVSASDIVHVCVPSGLHAKIASKVAAGGRHALVEKPIDVNTRAAEKLVETFDKAGLTLGVVSQHRFAQAIQKTREAAQGGAFGKLIQGDVIVKWYRTQAYYDSGDWRGTWKLDGGCLMNQTVHYIDMVQWIMGPIHAVRAISQTATHRMEAEDVAYALVEFSNGALGMIHGTTSAYPGYAERIEVYGECGSVVLEGDKVKAWHVDPEAPNDPSPYGKGVLSQPTPKVEIIEASGTEGTGASDPTAIWGEQHRMQIEDFVHAVRDGRPPFITGRDGLEPLKVINAIYASARKGGARVVVNPT